MSEPRPNGPGETIFALRDSLFCGRCGARTVYQNVGDGLPGITDLRCSACEQRSVSVPLALLQSLPSPRRNLQSRLASTLERVDDT